MKIAVLSDFHLGLGGKERQKESYENAVSALMLALSKKPDLLIVAGDLFNESIPSQDCLYESIKLFSIALDPTKNKKATVIPREGNPRDFSFRGTPIIAIHGTHEYRGVGQRTALDLLQEAGLFLKLHGDKAVFEKNGEKLCVYGMGGVPEKKALDVLSFLSPQPEENAFNVFVMHQSIKEYLPFDDEMVATISLSDFPRGFDLVVNGHLHWNKFDKINDQLFMMPGSTIITQMKKIEADSGKGIYFFDTKTREAEFVELAEQRKLFYRTIELKDTLPDEAKQVLRKEIEQILGNNLGLKPLIRIRLRGSLAKGVSSSDLDFSFVENDFSDKAIFSISKDFEIAQFKKKISELRKFQESNQSIKELALAILEKNLDETSFENAFDHEEMLRLLAEGKTEEALDFLTNHS